MNAPGYDNIYGQLISTSGELIGGWPAIADLITPIGSYFYVYTSKRAGQLDKEILLSVSIYDKRWGFLASSIMTQSKLPQNLEHNGRNTPIWGWDEGV